MRISDWSSAVCSSDLMNAAPHGCTVPCSWVEQTSSSNHDQLGLGCARLLERLQYGHEVAGACAKRVHRLHDVVQRDAGREAELLAALLLYIGSALGNPRHLPTRKQPQLSDPRVFGNLPRTAAVLYGSPSTTHQSPTHHIAPARSTDH